MESNKKETTGKKTKLVTDELTKTNHSGDKVNARISSQGNEKSGKKKKKNYQRFEAQTLYI